MVKSCIRVFFISTWFILFVYMLLLKMKQLILIYKFFGLSVSEKEKNFEKPVQRTKLMKRLFHLLALGRYCCW